MRRPLSTGLAVLCAAAAVAATAPGAATAATAEGPYDANGEVLNVLPPGSRGNVTVLDAAAVGPSRVATGTTPENFADQLEMYDALNTKGPGEVTDLAEYFKTAPIDLPAGQAVSTVTPRPGVTISRDRYGVPYVVGQTAEDVAFGAGYAGTQDRMFLTDLLRHVGAARATEFLGPSEANIAMDVGQLRSAAYTREEAEAQIESVLERFPAEGPGLLRRLDAFLEGINTAQRELCPGAFSAPVGEVTGGEAAPGAGLGPDCPVEYAALGNAPQDFTRADIVYIASLVGGIFGKGGGGEAANARWLRQLEARYGRAQALRVFEDLRTRNDPEAPTTASLRFPYNGDALDPDRPGVALPDLDGPRASGTGADAGSTGVDVPLPLPLAAGDAERAADFGVLDGPFGTLDLGLRPRGMSNALLVDAKNSASGHPTVVFGPQTGYFTPQLLTEISLRGPGIAARGVSFTGTQLVIELGHGVDYAWSATSASGDNVDTVAERLCSVDGGPTTVESTGYLVGTACKPFDSYVHTQTALPTAAGPGTPAVVRLQVLRTDHGIVQERTTVDGEPVALVLQRSTYGQELASAVGFARINDPAFTKDAASFQRAFDGVDYTFNWFYADDRDIAYFHSGLLPVRAPGVAADLPRFGDEAYDWRGFLPFAGKPKQVNPPKGYLTSWNNKQAPGFAAADDQWGYGAVYRSLLLDRRIEERIAGGRKVTRTGLVEAMQDAATADLRGDTLLPLLLDVVDVAGVDVAQPAGVSFEVASGDDRLLSEAIAVLREWVANDAHRVDRDRDGAYGDQAAIALFDEWWQGSDGSAVAKEVLRGELGDLVDQLPRGLDDHPRLGVGSAWNGIAWYGYVSKDLRQVLGRSVRAPYSRTYCGAGDLTACRTALRASLAAATQRVLERQGVDSVAELTYDKSQDAIRATTGGLVGTRPIDWQNRPTFQQVVGFTTHRPRGGAPAAAAPRALPRAAGATLPSTGPAGEALGLGVLLVLTAAVLLRRRGALR